MNEDERSRTGADDDLVWGAAGWELALVPPAETEPARRETGTRVPPWMLME